MAYDSVQRIWLPPCKHLHGDLTSWKLLVADIDASLIAAGIVHTSDTGQLDISAVSSIGSGANTTYLGYKIYAFNDSWQSTMPIYFRMDYGCGYDRSTSNGVQRALVIKLQFSTATNGSGTLTGTLSYQSKFPGNTVPDTAAGSDPTWPNYYQGTNYISHNKTVGFLGFLYQSLGRGTVASYTNQFATTNYAGCTIAFAVQRTHGPDGLPDGKGFVIYDPRRSWFNGNDHTFTSMSQTIWYSPAMTNSTAPTTWNADASSSGDIWLTYVPGLEYEGSWTTGGTPTHQPDSTYGGKPIAFPINYWNFDKGPTPFDCMAGFLANSSYGGGQLVTIETIPGLKRKFLILPHHSTFNFSRQFIFGASGADLRNSAAGRVAFLWE